jgi:hypothetical protein
MWRRNMFNSPNADGRQPLGPESKYLHYFMQIPAANLIDVRSDFGPREMNASVSQVANFRSNPLPKYQ